MHVFNVLTLFPEFFQGPLDVSILWRAIDRKLIKVNVLNIRDFSTDKHKKCDDHPYGGGAGMVMTPQPLQSGIQHLKKKNKSAKVILFSAKGRLLDQAMLYEMKKNRNFILIAGHYEGIDERIADHYVDYEISIGNYILTGGEYACLNFIDGVTRLLKGVLHNEDSHFEESFSGGLLEYDQYTRPEVFKNHKVPEVLLSGHHGLVKEWRQENRMKNTRTNRPDLLKEF